jgi:hypothetical protein
VTTFRKFTSVAEFDAWHDAYKTANGYPLPGVNAATGDISPLSVGPTTDYTAATEIGSADTRFVIMYTEVLDELGTVLIALPGDPANDPSWMFDTIHETLWVDADVWATVSLESQEAFKQYPDELGALGEPVDVVRDNIDYVVWAAVSITEDHLLALAEVMP